MANKDIIQELNDLGSSLGSTFSENIYSVPERYFEGFAAQVQSLIWLSSLPKSALYDVPATYFDGFEERIMQAIRSHPDYQTSREELESISPLLNSLNKRPVYSVPEGYFGNFEVKNEEQETESKVISLAGRKWLKYAAAAVITGVIALAGLSIYNSSKHSDAAGKAPLAKFEKEVKKIDDVKSTESLIDFMDAGLNEKGLASNSKGIRTEDVQQLLKDVSTDELREFSEQSKDIEDVMMTN